MKLARYLVLPCLLLLVAPPVRAQDSGEVLLRLIRQTPWNDPTLTSLALDVRAVNRTPDALDDLSVGVTIFTPARSRSAYHQSLEQDPESSSAILALVPPVAGLVGEGTSRTFHLSMDLAVLAQRDETAIYPMKVELRSHDRPLATLRSPVIFVSELPKVPLDLAWTFVLSAPILYGPDGTFRSSWLERQIEHGGQLRAEVEALGQLAARPKAPAVDVAIAPQLLEQLARMRDGYIVEVDGERREVAAGREGAADAIGMLRELKGLADAPSVELTALPFASPNLPALISAGLSDDLHAQLARGREDVESLLGREPPSSVLHPPGSHVSQAALFALHEEGVRLVLLDDGTVAPRPQDRGFAEPPDAALPVTSSESVTAIVPDAGVQSLLSSGLADQGPHLAAQVLLGELASIWLEQPSVSRGVAMMVPEGMRLPGFFLLPLVRSIAGVPWLRPIRATTLAVVHPPPREPGELLPERGARFSPSYLTELLEARQDISTYSSILTGDSPLPQALDRLVLLAEAGQFASAEDVGVSFLQEVSDRLHGEFTKVRPVTDTPVTLTSRTGSVPVTILNGSGHTLRVTVRLVSNRLDFVHGDTRSLEIPGGSVTLTFGVEARTTGRFPVQVLVETPDGQILSQGRLVVRSTAYNRIALVLTIGAALFLLALWARRFMPRLRRS